MDKRTDLPVAVIGAGPIGLAAAARLAERDLPAVVLEAGGEVGAAVRQWGHVRLFSPWRFNIDDAAARQLDEAGWEPPEASGHPTGDEFVDRYLAPLATLPRLKAALTLGARVTAVTRDGIDKLTTEGRERHPFVLTVRRDQSEERILARAVLDASGTWATPNPLGAAGVLAVGEQAAAARIFHGIPDVLGRARHRYAGKAVAVVGSGHSAQNTLRDLAELAEAAPATRVVWIVRHAEPRSPAAGEEDDDLPARGRLGEDARALVDSGAVTLVTGFRIDRVDRDRRGLILHAGERRIGGIDEIVAATGFRPDLSLLRELRLDLDPALEASRALGPLIDPDLHSCGTVPAHGAAELAQPEPDLYVVGAKSYGRAPTFLARTGYEQVRSVVAAIAGDQDEAASRVHVELPRGGACQPVARVPSTTASTPDATVCCEPAPAGGSCCG